MTGPGTETVLRLGIGAEDAIDFPDWDDSVAYSVLSPPDNGIPLIIIDDVWEPAVAGDESTFQGIAYLVGSVTGVVTRPTTLLLTFLTTTWTNDVDGWDNDAAVLHLRHMGHAIHETPDPPVAIRVTDSQIIRSLPNAPDLTRPFIWADMSRGDLAADIVDPAKSKYTDVAFNVVGTNTGNVVQRLFASNGHNGGSAITYATKAALDAALPPSTYIAGGGKQNDIARTTDEPGSGQAYWYSFEKARRHLGVDEPAEWRRRDVRTSGRMTLDVAPGGAGWAIGDTIRGESSGATRTIESVDSSTVYGLAAGGSGTYTSGEILTNETDTADQGAGFPVVVYPVAYIPHHWSRVPDITPGSLLEGRLDAYPDGTFVQFDIEDVPSGITGVVDEFNWSIDGDKTADHPENVDVAARYSALFLYCKRRWPNLVFGNYGFQNPNSARGGFGGVVNNDEMGRVSHNWFLQDKLLADQMCWGTAVSGSSTTIVLEPDTDYPDDSLIGREVHLTAGTGFPQTKDITAWDNTTKTATVASFSTAPDSTTVYYVEGDAQVSGVPTQWTEGDWTIVNDFLAGWWHKVDVQHGSYRWARLGADFVAPFIGPNHTTPEEDIAHQVVAQIHLERTMWPNQLVLPAVRWGSGVEPALDFYRNIIFEIYTHADGISIWAGNTAPRADVLAFLVDFSAYTQRAEGPFEPRWKTVQRYKTDNGL